MKLRKTKGVTPPKCKGLEIVVDWGAESGKRREYAFCFIDGVQVTPAEFLKVREQRDPTFDLFPYRHLPGIRDLPQFAEADAA